MCLVVPCCFIFELSMGGGTSVFPVLKASECLNQALTGRHAPRPLRPPSTPPSEVPLHTPVVGRTGLLPWHSNQQRDEGQTRALCFHTQGVFSGGQCQQMEKGLLTWAKTTPWRHINAGRLPCDRIAQEMGRRSPRPSCDRSQLWPESAKCLPRRWWTYYLWQDSKRGTRQSAEQEGSTC